MALKEFHKIDLQTGIVIDTCLFDDEIQQIPSDCKLGWGEGFHKPLWDFVENKWIEGLSFNKVLEPKRQAKVEEISNQCNEAIENGFEYEGDLFQFNMKDQSNFNQQLSLLLLDPSITGVQWKTENNGIKLFSKEKFILVCKQGENHKRKSIGRYWQLKQYILSTTFESADELESIDFSFSIPTS